MRLCEAAGTQKQLQGGAEWHPAVEEMGQTHPPSLPTGSILGLPTLSEISCDCGVIKCHNGLRAMQDRANWSKKYCYLAKPEGLRFGAESFVLQEYNLLLLILLSSSILMLTRCTEVIPCQRMEHRRPRISTLYKA